MKIYKDKKGNKYIIVRKKNWLTDKGLVYYPVHYPSRHHINVAMGEAYFDFSKKSVIKFIRNLK